MYRIIGADGNEYGPVSAEQIRAWIAEGRTNRATRIRLEASAEWRTVGELPEFAAAFAPPAAAAPPPLGGSAPSAAGPAVNPEALAQDLLARDVQFSIGECLSQGWELVLRDFWPILGTCVLIQLILGAANSAALGLLLNGPILGGMYYYFLKRIRGQAVTLNDAFAGFSLAILPLMLASLVSGLLTVVGIFCCILPGIYLAVGWWFTLPLVIDKGIDFWPAMEVSRKVVHRIWWRVLGFAIVCGLVYLAGMLLFCIGTFFTWTITMAASAYAYESIFNRGRQTAA